MNICGVIIATVEQSMTPNTYHRIFISLVLRDINVAKTIDCIEKAAFTGEIGDGMIFSYNIEESVRISNGARGEASTAGPGDKILTKLS